MIVKNKNRMFKKCKSLIYILSIRFYSEYTQTFSNTCRFNFPMLLYIYRNSNFIFCEIHFLNISLFHPAISPAISEKYCENHFIFL